MKLRTTATAALLLGILLSSCGQSEVPPPVTSSSSAPSAPTATASTQAQTGETAWDKYKREVSAAGFVNPNKDDNSVTDDQLRQSFEALCKGPDGAKGISDLYDISIRMKPQHVDMARIRQAAIDFCVSVG